MKEIILKWRWIILTGIYTIVYFGCNLALGPSDIPASASTNFINRGMMADVGFSCRNTEPDDSEVYKMIDEVILQTLGTNGLTSIIKPGDHVVIKVNNVSPNTGAPGKKGRGIITDARITRYIAEKIRDIIGTGETADLKVIDGCFSSNRDPSETNNTKSFAFARVQKPGSADIAYDANADGILDGASGAKLINLDSLFESDRKLTAVKLAGGNIVTVCMPLFLQKKSEAKPGEDYCDVFIGLPVFKSHGLLGITGALKLHYGLRPFYAVMGDAARQSHSGATDGNKQGMIDYLTAMHCIRSYDFVLMDALWGNRCGPINPSATQYYLNEDESPDLINSYSIIASKDPVALDTVETLLAGYRLDSIGILKTAYENGLGMYNPGLILIHGLDAFGNQRRFLSSAFQDGRGGARIYYGATSMSAITGISGPMLLTNGYYSFHYTINSANGISRVDFLAGGKQIFCKSFIDQSKGDVCFDLSEFAGATVEYRLAFWDKALNCVLSLTNSCQL